MEMRTYHQAYRDIVGNKSEANAEPSRIDAAKRVAEITKLLLTTGWKERTWRPGPGKPLAKKVGYLWEWNPPYGSFIDHPYILVNKRTNRTIYCLEPYGLGEDGIKALALLDAEQWDVSIDARLALHFPGETLVIRIEKQSTARHASEL